MIWVFRKKRLRHGRLVSCKKVARQAPRRRVFSVRKLASLTLIPHHSPRLAHICSRLEAKPPNSFLGCLSRTALACLLRFSGLERQQGKLRHWQTTLTIFGPL
jgi:hypothetical protein